MLITLLMLVAAFLGVDIPNAQAPTSGSCYAGASNGIDTEPGNFSEDWYAWEWCLYGGPWPVEGDFSRHGDLTTSQQVAQYVVNGIWQMYTPWMENALEASGPANASAKGKVTAPKVHVGQAAVDRHCNSPGWFGCGGGASVRWNGNRLTYQPGIIAVREINIFPLLHELAHAIDGHRWHLVTPPAAQPERTNAPAATASASSASHWTSTTSPDPSTPPPTRHSTASANDGRPATPRPKSKCACSNDSWTGLSGSPSGWS